MLLTEIVLFGIGLILLVKGSDIFVATAVKTAKQLGVSEFVIGLTLVALGTSIPEVGTSIVASFKHQGGIVLGNVIGSNIANINLIMGIIALSFILKTNRQMLVRDGYIMLFAGVLFALFMVNGVISRIEGFFCCSSMVLMSCLLSKRALNAISYTILRILLSTFLSLAIYALRERCCFKTHLIHQTPLQKSPYQKVSSLKICALSC